MAKFLNGYETLFICSNQGGRPSSTYGPPSTPSSQYGPPQASTPSSQYGPPQQQQPPSSQYGAPSTGGGSGNFGTLIMFTTYSPVFVGFFQTQICNIITCMYEYSHALPSFEAYQMSNALLTTHDVSISIDFYVENAQL